MLPLGLLLFAQDVPFLQTPMARMLGWIERKWLERQRAKAGRRQGEKAQEGSEGDLTGSGQYLKSTRPPHPVRPSAKLPFVPVASVKD